MMIEISMIRDLVAIFGVIAGISYYVLTVRATKRNQDLQLETRQAQLFMQMFNKMWSPESKEIVKILGTSWYATDEEWLERFNSDTEFHYAFEAYANSWEAIGTLLKKDYFDVELLALYVSTNTISEWERYRSIIRDMQSRNRRAYDMWEYTYDSLMEYLEEHPELAPGPPANLPLGVSKSLN